jgi:hypothetical protein
VASSGGGSAGRGFARSTASGAAAASQNFNGGFVIDFTNGQMPGKLLPATKLGTDFPGNVTVGHPDNLLLIDQNTTSVLVFAPPYTSRPFKTIEIKVT